MMASTPAAGGRIFISYYREDTAYPAGWLYDQLAGHFARSQVFKDPDPSIELGDDFVEAITTAVGSCDVLLALIGDRWLTVTGQDGRRCLDNPDNFVRVAIEAALARDVRVIPILVEGARMPRADELPASLSKLARRQALVLSPSSFDSDTATLLRTLDGVLADAQIHESTLRGKIPTARPENSCNMPSRRHGNNRRPATRSSKGLTSRRHLARKLGRRGNPDPGNSARAAKHLPLLPTRRHPRVRTRHIPEPGR